VGGAGQLIPWPPDREIKNGNPRGKGTERERRRQNESGSSAKRGIKDHRARKQKVEGKGEVLSQGKRGGAMVGVGESYEERRSLETAIKE